MDTLRIISLTSLLVLLSQAVSSHEKVPSYTLQDLGLGSSVVGISNTGIVAATDMTGLDAVLYWTDGSNEIRDLALDPRLPAVCGFKSPYTPLFVFSGAISRNGKVAVNAIPNFNFMSTGPNCVAVYDPEGAGTWTYKRTLGPSGAATGINDAGQVIGQLTDVEGFGPECSFGSGGDTVSAEAINDKGQIVGIESNAGNLQLCTHGVWRVLIPDFPGSISAINNKGEIVGDQDEQAFLYRDGKTTDLGTLPGSVFSFAYSINERSQITGINLFSAGQQFAGFLYQDGVMYDLAALMSPADQEKILYFVGDAHINDRGVIATSGFGIDGLAHLYVLTPH